MIDILMPLIKQFMPFAQKKIGFKKPPKLFLKQDAKNAENPLGKTAHYDPQEQSVTLYISGRHPKDVLRSLGHELVHHKQNCDGKFDDVGEMGEGYAQNNPHLRAMEFEANSLGSMCLRDFEDGLRERKTIYYEHLQKGENTMSTKDWKNNELNILLKEAWGFKFNTLQEFDEFNGTGEIQETADLEEGGETTSRINKSRKMRGDIEKAQRRKEEEERRQKEKEGKEKEVAAEGVEPDLEEARETGKTSRMAGLRGTRGDIEAAGEPDCPEGKELVDGICTEKSEEVAAEGVEPDLEEYATQGQPKATHRAAKSTRERAKAQEKKQKLADEAAAEAKKKKQQAAEGLRSDPQQQLREAIAKMLRKHL